MRRRSRAEAQERLRRVLASMFRVRDADAHDAVTPPADRLREVACYHPVACQPASNASTGTASPRTWSICAARRPIAAAYSCGRL